MELNNETTQSHLINHTILLSYSHDEQFEEAQQEKRIGVVQTYDAFATSILQLGLVVGIWSQPPLIDGKEMKSEAVLPNIPKEPLFFIRDRTRFSSPSSDVYDLCKRGSKYSISFHF